MADVHDVSFIPLNETPRAAPHSQAESISLPIVIWLGSWITPAAAARRMSRVPLSGCWLIHVLTAVAGLFLVPGVLLSPAAPLRAFESFWDEWYRWPAATSAILLGIVLGVEAGHLGVALIVSAWGANPHEWVRDSFRHALRQVLLRTPHTLLIVLLIGLTAKTLDQASKQWHAEHGHSPSFQWGAWPNPPTIPPTDPSYRASQRKYLKEMQDYRVRAAQAQQAWQQWWRTQPWYIRHEEPLMVGVGMLATVWWLAALLRAVGIKRDVSTAPIAPPRCLACGYDLTTMQMEARCPECGRQVSASLGPQAHPGPAWERRASVGTLNAWRHTYHKPLAGPAFGRELRLSAVPRHARVFLLVHLPVIFAIGAAGLAAGVIQEEGLEELLNDKSLAILVLSLFGTACVLGAVLVVCGVASLIGLFFSIKSGRNLLPASIQVAAYGATYLTVWAVFGAVLINAVMHLFLAGMYQVAHEFTGLHNDILLSGSCLLPNLLCGLAYLWLVARGTSAARFANR